MPIRRIAAAVTLAAATLAAGAGTATADEEFPRNGVVPPGSYHVTRHPANVLGSPVENCDLQVHAAPAVTLACPAFTLTGRQTPIGPDQTHVTFDGFPLGLDLHDIDPRQGLWIGTINIAGTPLAAPYPIAGVSLFRR